MKSLKSKKERLDLLVAAQNPHLSRAQVQSFIMQGKVAVNGQVVTKAGTQIASDAEIILTVDEPKFVSRAGLKLEHALDHFAIDVANLVVLDAGLSTGGFTDCLLSRGAKRIYGVDVGYGQVHEKIRNDKRVILMERTNLRYLTSLPEPIDLVTLDLSFISVLKVIPAVKKLLKSDGAILILIKPQFEATRAEVGRGGIVKDESVHQRVIERVQNGMAEHGFSSVGVVESPIRGGAGNKEFLAYFKRIS